MNTGLSFVCRDENGFKDNSRHCVCVLPSFSLALCVFIYARLSVFPLFPLLFFCFWLLVSPPFYFIFFVLWVVLHGFFSGFSSLFSPLIFLPSYLGIFFSVFMLCFALLVSSLIFGSPSSYSHRLGSVFIV